MNSTYYARLYHQQERAISDNYSLQQHTIMELTVNATLFQFSEFSEPRLCDFHEMKQVLPMNELNEPPDNDGLETVSARLDLKTASAFI